MVVTWVCASSVVGLTISGNEAIRVGNAVNLMWRVLNLLQDMAKKVAEEGGAEKALYERFECYCKTGGADLRKSSKRAVAA